MLHNADIKCMETINRSASTKLKQVNACCI